MHQPRLRVGPRQAGEDVAKQGGHRVRTVGSRLGFAVESRSWWTTIRALFATKRWGGEGFLAESGGVRARACARGNSRLENEKRARNARECARGSEAQQRRAGARRVFHVSLMTWLFGFSRQSRGENSRFFMIWTNGRRFIEEDTRELPTLPHAHAAQRARSLLSPLLNHQHGSSRHEARPRRCVSSPRLLKKIDFLPKMRSRAKRKYRNNDAVWQFWSSRRSRSRHVSSSKCRHRSSRTAKAARVTTSKRSRVSLRTRARNARLGTSRVSELAC